MIVAGNAGGLRKLPGLVRSFKDRAVLKLLDQRTLNFLPRDL